VSNAQLLWSGARDVKVRRRLLFVAMLVLVTANPIAADGQQPSFSAHIEAVRVDVLVTDAGTPIRGLAATDFEIIDNGVPQQVDLVSFEQLPLNLVLALDMSDSVAGERLEHLRAAGHAALAALQQRDRASLLTFSHRVSLAAPLSLDLNAVRQALDEAAGSGETALVDGTFAAMTVGESDAGRALLIVFSDGVDTASWLTADAVLSDAKQSDVVAYGVSVRSKVKPEFLRDFTAATGGRLFEIEKTGDLAQTFRSIVDEFRHRYVVSYSPRGVSKTGWHRLEVHVKRRGASVRARPGYLAGS
jgi:VWFA-related protein